VVEKITEEKKMSSNRDSNVPASEAALEERIAAAGLTAPRVTPQQVDDQIVSEHYFTARDGVFGAGYLGNASDNLVSASSPLALLTFCVLVLRNGFVLTGESACASPENFNAAIGREIARRNARDKIWSLEGYALRNQLMAVQR
jgi:hypothetical protein